MTGTTQYDFNSSLLQALTGVQATSMDNSKRIEFMAKEISNLSTLQASLDNINAKVEKISEEL